MTRTLKRWRAGLARVLQATQRRLNSDISADFDQYRPAASVIASLLAIVFVVSGVSPALAQDYPERGVKIIVPYPPGAFNDTLGRTVAERLSRTYKHPVVVENRPGANTTLGNGLVAKSVGDPHMILVSPLPFSALPGLYGANLPYDAIKDFSPLVWAGSSNNVLVVKNDLPVSSVKEFIELAQKNPGKLNYASTGSGSSNHLSMELFMKMTGARLAHIPYKGSAPAVTALIAGEVDAFFDNLPNVLPHIRAGKMKALAVTGKTRATLLPDLPTVAEAGVPGYDVTVWFGMQMPAGVPRPVLERVNRDIVAVLRDPEIVARFRAAGVEVVASTPDEFAAQVRSEIAKWTQLIREANIRIE